LAHFVKIEIRHGHFFLLSEVGLLFSPKLTNPCSLQQKKRTYDNGHGLGNYRKKKKNNDCFYGKFVKFGSVAVAEKEREKVVVSWNIREFGICKEKGYYF